MIYSATGGIHFVNNNGFKAIEGNTHLMEKIFANIMLLQEGS